jgi:hypothetical protein
VKPGAHKVQVTKAGYEFAVTDTVIKSEKPTLSVLTPISVSVCASVIEESAVLEVYRGSEMIQSSTGNTHCFLLPAGTYQIKPVAAGVHFSPSQHEVTVEHESLDTPVFVRFTRSFEAFVTCLGTCGSFSAEMKSQSTGELIPVTISETDEPSRSKISHASLNPGGYKLIVSNPHWCFTEPSGKTSVNVQVVAESLPVEEPVVITQKSFMMQIKSDYALKIEIVNKDQKIVEETEIGLNKYCVNALGVYEITPISCHNFDSEKYNFDTESPKLIDLKAVSHHQVNTAKLSLTWIFFKFHNIAKK